MKSLLVALLVSVGLLLGSIVTEQFKIPSTPLKVIALHSAERDKELLDWVLQWMNYPDRLNVPVTRRLIQRDIQYIFCGIIPSKCTTDKIKNIVGIFDHTSETVYVVDTIDTCKSEILTVHEYAHYVQHYRDGSLTKVSRFMVDMVLSLREREAYELDAMFEVMNCKEKTQQNATIQAY